MQIARAALLARIVASRFGMRAQIVAESEMALHIRRPRCEEMQLRAAVADVVERAIASARNAQLAMPFEAEALHAGTELVERVDIGHDRHEIDDRLGDEPRDRGRADMMERRQNRAENLEARRQAGRDRRPGGIIVGEDHGDRRRHEALRRSNARL